MDLLSVVLGTAITLLWLNAKLFSKEFWGLRDLPMEWGWKMRNRRYHHGLTKENQEPELAVIDVNRFAMKHPAPSWATYTLARYLTAILGCGYCFGFWATLVVAAVRAGTTLESFEMALLGAALAGTLDGLQHRR